MSKATLYQLFIKAGMNEYGACGLLANVDWESGCNPMNLQNSGNKKLNMTDAEYTKAVDSGQYTQQQFISDSQGYGLAQWTYSSRKASLYDYAKRSKRSIGDLTMQAEFLLAEIKLYKGVWDTLKTAKSLEEATKAVMLKYERPADQSASAIAKRCNVAERLYDEFCGTFKKATAEVSVLKKNAKGEPVRVLQAILNAKGFDCGKIDGSFGSGTDKAVRDFQKSKGLAVDGSAGPATWTALLN